MPIFLFHHCIHIFCSDFFYEFDWNFPNSIFRALAKHLHWSKSFYKCIHMCRNVKLWSQLNPTMLQMWLQHVWSHVILTLVRKCCVWLAMRFLIVKICPRNCINSAHPYCFRMQRISMMMNLTSTPTFRKMWNETAVWAICGISKSLLAPALALAFCSTGNLKKKKESQ